MGDSLTHVDTNVLIALVSQAHSHHVEARVWFEGHREVAVSSITWHEFFRGPLTVQQFQVIRQIIGGNILPLARAEAERAAGLFNLTGRRRGSGGDCLVAACAIEAGSPILTFNDADFMRFVPHGLKMQKW